MKITALRLAGVFLIELEPIVDERGYFLRVYDEDVFAASGLNARWVQENQSHNGREGTVRGLHFQLQPHSETKLVRVVGGKVWDVFVDLRRGSPSFGLWEAMELSAQRQNMVYIPRGLAHGYCTLTDESTVVYKTDRFYRPDHECAILWNDSDLAIPWPVKNPILSARDRSNMTLAEFVRRHQGIDV